MKKFLPHPCAANAKLGDQIEFETSNGPERHKVVGHFKLSTERVVVPVVGVNGGMNCHLENYYYKDVVCGGEMISEPFCLPIHEKFVTASIILKVIRKQ